MGHHSVFLPGLPIILSVFFSDLHAKHSDLENCLQQDGEMAIVIYASNRFFLSKGTGWKHLAQNLFQLTSEKIEQNLPVW